MFYIISQLLLLQELCKFQSTKDISADLILCFLLLVIWILMKLKLLTISAATLDEDRVVFTPLFLRAMCVFSCVGRNCSLWYILKI